jgi:hypothetical protein
MEPLNLEVITEDDTGDVIGILIDDIPQFENLLLDDEKEIVYWKVDDGDNERILVTTFDGWNNHVKEMYLEAMEEFFVREGELGI